MASAVRSWESPDPAVQLSTGFRLAAVGLVLAVVGAGVQFLNAGSWSAGLGIILGVTGTIVSGLAVTARPTNNRILGLAALTAFAAIFSANEAWGSVRLMLAVITGVAVLATILFTLSRTARLVAVSLLLVYHFGGVLSAITSPPPTPWLTSQAWVRVFRPHLEFCYVNNAYQFYSPEPGPANILWFCITGEDNKSEWLKVPGRDENYDPLGVEYYRRLSITERANGNEILPLGPPPDSYQRRRMYENEYPFHPEATHAMQFRMPDENSRQFLRSYARHVSKTYGSGRPGVPVKSIKVYLTQHRLLSQDQYAGKDARMSDPYDKASYLPFFVGDFDAEGRMLNPLDPLLYWLVPIIKVPKYNPETGAPIAGAAEYKNYVHIHAGSDPFEKP